MLVWWLLSILEMVLDTVVHIYATTHDNLASLPERLVILVVVLERTVTVFILNSPDSSIRIGVNTIASIITILAMLVMKTSRLTVSPRSRFLCLLGRVLVFAVGIAQTGAVLFMRVIKQAVESQTGSVVAPTPNDEALFRYAVFQGVIVSMVFILHLTAWCSEPQQPATITKQQEKQE
jgi:hypothetical protein